jgi:hypothetical protein
VQAGTDLFGEFGFAIHSVLVGGSWCRGVGDHFGDQSRRAFDKKRASSFQLDFAFDLV